MTIDLRHAAIAVAHCIVAVLYALDGHETEAIGVLLIATAYAATCVRRRD
ncbi:MAG: hypothetical protein U1E56_01465 [Bauldia sp.]